MANFRLQLEGPEERSLVFIGLLDGGKDFKPVVEVGIGRQVDGYRIMKFKPEEMIAFLGKVVKELGYHSEHQQTVVISRHPGAVAKLLIAELKGNIEQKQIEFLSAFIQDSFYWAPEMWGEHIGRLYHWLTVVVGVSRLYEADCPLWVKRVWSTFAYRTMEQLEADIQATRDEFNAAKPDASNS